MMAFMSDLGLQNAGTFLCSMSPCSLHALRRPMPGPEPMMLAAVAKKLYCPVVEPGDSYSRAAMRRRALPCKWTDAPTARPARRHRMRLSAQRILRAHCVRRRQFAEHAQR